jgi:hypothetical protein
MRVPELISRFFQRKTYEIDIGPIYGHGIAPCISMVGPITAKTKTSTLCMYFCENL